MTDDDLRRILQRGLANGVAWLRTHLVIDALLAATLVGLTLAVALVRDGSVGWADVGVGTALGLGAVLLLALGALAVGIARAPALIRREDAAAELSERLAAGDDSGVARILEQQFRRAGLGISTLIAFGSVVQQRTTNDLDLVVQLKEGSDKVTLRRIRAIKREARALEEQLALPFHLTWFESGDEARLRAFLVRAGAYSVILGTLD